MVHGPVRFMVGLHGPQVLRGPYHWVSIPETDNHCRLADNRPHEHLTAIDSSPLLPHPSLFCSFVHEIHRFRRHCISAADRRSILLKPLSTGDVGRATSILSVQMGSILTWVYDAVYWFSSELSLRETLQPNSLSCLSSENYACLRQSQQRSR